MTERSIAHGSFTVIRTYPASRARVWQAWSDPVAKAKWFGSPGRPGDIFDFREGGREYTKAEFGGDTYTVDIRYEEILPGERIIYTYAMTMNGQRISVSVATIELEDDGAGTRLTVVEHGAYLDGLDNMRQREEGTCALMDTLGTTLTH
jgi:uncharacterized protein YndB with AHSA1/START domain